jgi:hypothetical protein
MEETMVTRLGQRKVESMAWFFGVILSSLLASPATAADVSHGEMAAAIRSADYPCAHVLKIDSSGDDAWLVQCNSGSFRVSRDQDGRFKVTRAGTQPDK